MTDPARLTDVLAKISAAKDAADLRAVAPQAARLSDADKGIARWAYAYAQAQLLEGRPT